MPTLNGGTIISHVATDAAINNTEWDETKATSFDALDRSVANWKFAVGTSRVVHASSTYDTNGEYGLLSSHCNELNACSTMSYDQLGRAIGVQFNDGLTPSRSSTFDPAGRIKSISSSAFATPQTYIYDIDGRETQSTEASGGAMTSPATITHNYYADGKLKSIDVQSSALTQAGLFVYSYGADGSLVQHQINDAGNPLVGNTALNYTHDAAGRMLSQSESAPVNITQPITKSYDPRTGQLASMVVPAATTNQFQYDAAGHMLGYQWTTISGAKSGSINQLNLRGELVKNATDGDYRNPSMQFADGESLSVPAPSTGSTLQTAWDARNGITISTDYNDTSGSVTGSTYTFDDAGRVVKTSNSDSKSVSVTMRRFDAENHTIGLTFAIAANYPYAAQSTGYVWGPAGHPMLIGSSIPEQIPNLSSPTTVNPISYESLHWDGDTLLFTTNPQGQLDDIKVGTLADITPLDPNYKGITFWDRDPSGAIAFCHNGLGAGGNGPAAQIQSKFLTATKPACSGSNFSSFPNSIVWNGGAFTLCFSLG